MSDIDPVDAINQALEGQLHGIDVQGIVSRQLNRLQEDYQNTLNAKIEGSDQEQSNSDQSDYGEYQQCPSEGSSQEEQQKEDIPEVSLDKEEDINFSLTQEKKEKIKEIMKKVHLKEPPWARLVQWDKLQLKQLISNFL